MKNLFEFLIKYKNIIKKLMVLLLLVVVFCTLYNKYIKIPDEVLPEVENWWEYPETPIEYFEWEDEETIVGLTRIGQTRTVISIPAKCKNIEPYALEASKAIKILIIPNSVEYMPQHISANRETLEKAYFNANVKHIPTGFFTGCTNLNEVIIETPVQQVNAFAFNDCINLKTIEFTDNLVYIQQGIFKDCTNLEKVYLGNNLKKISYQAFANCENLEDVNMPSNLKTIEKNAFKNCISLSTIVFPETLEIIESEAYKGCRLLDLTFPANFENLGANVFDMAEENAVVRVHKKSYMLTNFEKYFDEEKVAWAYVEVQA